jgi:general secretion pathway protein A
LLVGFTEETRLITGEMAAQAVSEIVGRTPHGKATGFFRRLFSNLSRW